MVDEKTSPVVETIVAENVSLPLTECKNYLRRAEAPYLPLTITTYRAIAFKKFKALLLANLKAGKKVDIESLTTEFCQKVDREILDKQFYYVVKEQYHKQILSHTLNN